MGPDCGLSQEMNWRVWSGLSPLITHHRDGAISRLGITSGVMSQMSGVTSWPEKRPKNHCVNSTPSWVLNLYYNCNYKWSWIIFSFLTVSHPTQCTPMWEPLLWCNVQSAVLPGILVYVARLLGRDHSLPQSSEELVTVNSHKAVMEHTRCAQYYQPCDELVNPLTLCASNTVTFEENISG